MATVEVTGLRQFVRAMEAKGAALADLKAAMQATGEMIAQTARPLTNPQTGRLAGSVRPSKTKNKAVVRAGGARTPHAAPQHFGWPRRNIRPKLFLYKAADQRRDQILTKFHQEIAKAIKE